MSDFLPSCPDCHSPLPADSPQALCPACLMRQALASRTRVQEGGSRPETPPPSPEEIAGRFPQFEILECLGRGGMGVVYKARQKSLNRLVAIKILAPERGHETRFAERFAREAELLAKLNHPHIVTIHDFGVADSPPSTPDSPPLYYLVMEFVDGVNLRDLLREGKLEAKQALAIVPPICEALQYAHDKGIVHRDIKPENLLLDRDGRIKIADFGIAALLGTDGDSAGTPPYMAPEQSRASEEVDSRADIYALGVVLYEMLTGERPGKDLVAPSRKVQIDVRLDEIVLRALERTPELRYQTAGEFRTVLETMGEPEDGRGAPADGKRKRRRKKVVFNFPDPMPGKGALLGLATELTVSGILSAALLLVFGEEVLRSMSRWVPEAAQVPRAFRFCLMGIGLLATVMLVGGLVHLIRKPLSGFKPSWPRSMRRMIGVAGLFGILICGWLLLKKDRFYPASSLNAGYKAPVIGQVGFTFTHPSGNDGGSFSKSFPVKAWGDSLWSDWMGLDLGFQRSIQCRVRVDASRSEFPVAMVTTSLNGIHSETREVVLRAEKRIQVIDFANGLQVAVSWSPVDVPDLEKRLPDAIQRAVMREASAMADAQHPITGSRRATAFGPVMERTVNELESGRGREALCLESGELVSLPGENTPQWLVDAPVDLLVGRTGRDFQLILQKGILRDVGNADWDHASPEILRKALEQGPGEMKPGNSDKGWAAYEWTGGELPATLAFRLASGIEGVVQVLGADEGGSGMRIRYKLARDGMPGATTLGGPTPQAASPVPETRHTGSLSVGIRGPVAMPGEHSLMANSTLLDVLAVAGGWTGEDSLCAEISERRENELVGTTKHDLRAILDGRAVNPTVANGAMIILTRTQP